MLKSLSYVHIRLTFCWTVTIGISSGYLEHSKHYRIVKVRELQLYKNYLKHIDYSEKVSLD
jgi:hypothetical protein